MAESLSIETPRSCNAEERKRQLDRYSKFLACSWASSFGLISEGGEVMGA